VNWDAAQRLRTLESFALSAIAGTAGKTLHPEGVARDAMAIAEALWAELQVRVEAARAEPLERVTQGADTVSEAQLRLRQAEGMSSTEMLRRLGSIPREEKIAALTEQFLREHPQQRLETKSAYMDRVEAFVRIGVAEAGL
jgi:hypothetical protein